MDNPGMDDILNDIENIAFSKFSQDRAEKTEKELIQFFNEMELTDADDDEQGNSDNDVYEDAQDFVDAENKAEAGDQADASDDESDGDRRLKTALKKELDLAKLLQGDVDTSDDNRRRYGHMRRTERLILQDLLRRHNVLLIRVGYNSESDDQYFFDCAEIVHSKTDSCLIFANNINKGKDSVRQMAERTKFLCGWLPETIFGYLRNPLYFLRSWFTAIASYRLSLKFAPTMVFIDAHPVAIPLLKILYDCPVLSFYFYDKMLDRTRFIYLPRTPRTAPQAARNFCLSLADELLVPSQATAYKYTEQRKDCSFTPIAFYPPCHGKGMMPAISKEIFNFLIIGPWQNYANMDFAFQACERFYNVILCKELKPKFRFIFIGFMDVNDQDANGYKLRMYQVFKDAKGSFADNIITVTNPTHSELWDHYRTCIGVLSVTTSDFAWPVLEGIYFGKQVICINNLFTREVIEHGTNGFLQKLDVNEFAEHMRILFTFALSPSPTYSAQTLLKNYSHPGRKIILNQLLLKYFPLTKKELYD